MRAWVADRPGGPDVLTLREVPDPVPDPDEHLLVPGLPEHPRPNLH